jgi:hypothetical protein
VRAEGNTTIEKERLVGQRIEALRSWGKHFLIELDDFSLKVHFLLFGSYRINQRKEAPPRLSLGFDSGELNLYACPVRFIEEPLDLVYDWHAEVMSEHWDRRWRAGDCARIPGCWPATPCWTRTSLREWATSGAAFSASAARCGTSQADPEPASSARTASPGRVPASGAACRAARRIA